MTGAAMTTLGKGREAGGTLLVTRPSMRRPLVARVAPAPRGDAVPALSGHPAVLVFLSDPEAAEEPDDAVLRRLYGLTRAESRLAGALMRGKSLGEAANELGITYHTARTQVKSVFGKTGTRRQGELIRILSSLPGRVADHVHRKQ